MKKITKAIVATAIAIGVIVFFFAPIVPMNVANLLIRSYTGDCYGVHSRSALTQVYVSPSYRLIPAPDHITYGGNWGVVYLPNGIPPDNHSVAYFPPITNPPPSAVICA